MKELLLGFGQAKGPMQQMLDQWRARSTGTVRRVRTVASRLASAGRPFSKDANERLLIVSLDSKISQAQIYPFHFFRPDLERSFEADIREVDLGDVMAGRPIAAKDATVVAFQTALNASPNDMITLIRRIRQSNPEARLAFLDWRAPTDLHYAAHIGDLVDFCVKKHVLRDRSMYGSATIGDTNLTDHFNRRYGLHEPMQTFPVSQGFLRKLIIGPPFCTAPDLLSGLMNPGRHDRARPIDLHARFETQGQNWYGEMRREALAAVTKLDGRTVLTGNGVSRQSFIGELKRSKACFSPFGYGEVCWRDYEAIMTGTVLLKPDMQHVETFPDIFRPWETYVPLQWDFSDLAQKVDMVIGDETLRRRLTEAAHAVLQNYLKSSAFTDTLRPLFQRPITISN